MPRIISENCEAFLDFLLKAYNLDWQDIRL